MNLEVININSWILQNQKFFQPPVCNKMMHNEQLKVMFVGGPNIRKDYHIEEGEEFFYMLKGDMCLKVLEHGKHKDISIKEGEVFLLPARIPHSPQRFADTFGLVIERKRFKQEIDILRYFVGESTDVLYEEAFYCKDLGTQLAPIIKAFFNSNAAKTGIPDKDHILDEMPFKLDEESSLMTPSPLNVYLDRAKNSADLFSGKYQFDIKIFYEGEDEQNSGEVEHWIWQITGSSLILVGEEEKFLQKSDSILIPLNTRYKWKRQSESNAIRVFQDPNRK